mgnify:CR=1 FL=1
MGKTLVLTNLVAMYLFESIIYVMHCLLEVKRMVKSKIRSVLAMGGLRLNTNH